VAALVAEQNSAEHWVALLRFVHFHHLAGAEPDHRIRAEARTGYERR
jgi:hypothetical protein